MIWEQERKKKRFLISKYMGRQKIENDESNVMGELSYL
jgi:hypothetical protein